MTSRFDTLASSLPAGRRPDIALGLLLAAELLDELPGIPVDYTRVLRTAITDAATAVHDHPLTMLTELERTGGHHART